MRSTFQAIPIFRIFDVAKAKEFYVGFLGFQVDWEHRFDETAGADHRPRDLPPGDHREGLPLHAPGPRAGAVER
jgi:catechol 2,3-dioxygenase-like lactoylglutathione lyase family enzyme